MQLQKIYPSSKYQNQLMGSPIHWALWILTLGVEWPGHDINHACLVLRLKTSGVIPPLPVCIHIGATSFK